MRIGLDARYVYPSHVHGIGRYSAELVRHLVPRVRARGHELVVFRRADLPEPLARGDGVREIPVPFLPVSLATLTRLGPIARAERLDVFHAFFPVLPIGAAPRTVVTAHDLQALRVRGFHGGRGPVVALASRLFYGLAYRWSFGAADRILAGSAWTRDDVMSTYRIPSRRFRVVHEGLGDAFFEPGDETGDPAVLASVGLDASRPYLLHVGNTRPQKNVEGLLDVFRALVDRAESGAAPVLVIAGVRDRFFDGVQRRAARLGLVERVRFLENVSDAALRALYRRAALYVTMALHEGFGFTPLEAMASGCPVAAAAAGALPEVLGDAYLALPTESPTQAACAILGLLGDPTARAALVAAGRARATRFRWETTARETLDAYLELASPAPALVS
ncbi:MAG: glycosyltransferase family 1 protein [bacterium]